MKTRSHIITIAAFLLCCIMQLNAQQGESLRDRIARRQNAQVSSSVPQVTIRTEMKNQEQKQYTENASWVREVYRFLDLTKGVNGALYNPVQPTGDRMNLYTAIFNLLADGNLIAYKFIDINRESFTQDAVIDFKDVLDNLKIPFMKEGNVYKVDRYDVPSSEVRGYYIKEAHYFDQTNSLLDTKLIAICPMLMIQDGYDTGATRYPQFWILYEDLRPYISRMPIMTSDINNVMNKTVDDFFRLNLYDGEIYKTTNLENKILKDIYKTPEEMKAAQERIEDEIRQFEKNLWIMNDSVYIKSEAERTGQKSNSNTKTQKSKSSSQASYSARDRR